MKLTKKKLSLLIGGAALAVVLVVAGVFALRNAGAGKTADRPVKISSALDMGSWLAEGKKVNETQGGTYYMQLTGDITLKKEAVVTGGNTVYFDLNGHTISGGANRAFSVTDGGKLILTGGRVETEGADADGGVFAVEGAGSALTLEKVFAANTDDSHIVGRVGGGVIYANSPGDAESCATVTLGQDVELVGSITGLRRGGGSIMLNGNAELHIDGAKVTGGKAGIAGNILLDGKAKMYLYSGTVSGGAAVGNSNITGFGGNINAQSMSQVHIYGGMVTAGTADRSGGNLYIANTAGEASGLYLYGGAVEKGLAEMEGGNIYATEKATVLRLYGGELLDGDAVQGGNISLHNAAMELRGSTLTGLATSTDITYGGNVYASNAKIALYSGVIDQGVAQKQGGNVYITDTEMNIYGGSITRGATVEATVSVGGGNLFAGRASTVNMYGGEISGGIANVMDDKENSAAGANVMIAGTTFMQLFGGTIQDGTVHGAISRGGGVYVYGQAAKYDALFHMYGGTVSNGLTDNKMRGMCIGAYSSTNDDTGKGTARLFGGDVVYTGPADSADKVYTIHGNKTNKTDMYVFDAERYKGMCNRTTLGPCPDASHNTVTEQVEATCLTQGYTLHSCNTCGQWCEITAQPTGHTEETAQTETGLTEHKCTTCQEVRYTSDEQ